MRGSEGMWGPSKRVAFVDTHFWLALTLARDPWHQNAMRARQSLQGVRLVTTDGVLVELLNFVSEYGAHVRREMAGFVRTVLAGSDVDVIPCSGDVFHAGLDLYAQRPDKGYSLTDCFSMVVMRGLGIDAVLTHDRHFAQEGFRVLSL